MKWSRDRSIVLSKLCIFGFVIGVAVCAMGLPVVVDGIARRRGWEGTMLRTFFLITAYGLMIPAGFALGHLYRLLENIRKEEVFVRKNVLYLRWISWACLLAALICFLSGFYYLPFGVLAAGAAFMGLILRIVKNVFAEAVNIKEEHDFTI